MSERRRHCFSSCSSSESGCLKYSIRSFSVCSTSSTNPATSVEPPSVMRSRALSRENACETTAGTRGRRIAGPLLPDEVGEEEGGVADDPSSARLLVLAALQDEAVVHVTLQMQAGLKKPHSYQSTLKVIMYRISKRVMQNLLNDTGNFIISTYNMTFFCKLSRSLTLS